MTVTKEHNFLFGARMEGDLNEAESDVVLCDVLVRLAEEGRGGDALQAALLGQPLGEPGGEDDEDR